MDDDKTNNIYFPLCCLNYDKDIKNTAELIISYGIVEFGKKLESEIELYEGDTNRINDYIEKNNLINEYDEADNFLILSAIKLSIDIPDLYYTKMKHSKLINYIRIYESKHGKDAKVKVHKSLLFEVRDGIFDERMFRVYCAVVSSIGDNIFWRIVIDTIAVRMLGFKSKKICSIEKSKYKKLTARQVKTTIDKLSETGKNFFAMRTYRNRQTFYSTKLRGIEFDEVLTERLALNKAKKEINKIHNENIESGIDKKFIEYKEKLKSGESIKEIKSNMELYKTG